MPWLVVLVLEATLSRPEVGGTGDVASIITWVWPLNEHVPPRSISSRNSTTQAPNSNKKISTLVSNFVPLKSLKLENF